MAAITITEKNFDTEVLQSAKPVLLDFWAPWCGPCRMVSPIVVEIAQEETAVKVGKVNVDENPELAQKFGVMSIPTLVVIKDGKVSQRAVGARPAARLRAPVRRTRRRPRNCDRPRRSARKRPCRASSVRA